MITEKIILDIDGVEYEGRMATIEHTSLGYEDHGIPTAWLHLGGEGWGQGAGGYSLKGEAMSVFVLSVLDALKVDSWEKLRGLKVMALYEPGSNLYPVAGVKLAVGGKPFLFKQAFVEAGLV